MPPCGDPAPPGGGKGKGGMPIGGGPPGMFGKGGIPLGGIPPGPGGILGIGKGGMFGGMLGAVRLLEKAHREGLLKLTYVLRAP
jgi:hypothetical protein